MSPSKTILITGATSGHGYYLAKKLSKHNCVLLHGKDPERTETLARELGARPYVADLSELAQVRRLAEEVKDGYDKIDILINNAGIGYGVEREVSKDGCELRFALMYLAPVVLTKSLLPLITSQVLNIGSAGQEPIDFQDLQMQKNYNGMSAYRRSKLALAMWTFDLALERPDLKINVVHPATFMDTNMIRRAGATPINTVEFGGENTLRVLESSLTGTFFNQDRPAGAHVDAYDINLMRKLREATEQITGPI